MFRVAAALATTGLGGCRTLISFLYVVARIVPAHPQRSYPVKRNSAARQSAETQQGRANQKDFQECDRAHTGVAWKRTIITPGSHDFEQGGGGDRTLCPRKQISSGRTGPRWEAAETGTASLVRFPS